MKKKEAVLFLVIGIAGAVIFFIKIILAEKIFFTFPIRAVFFLIFNFAALQLLIFRNNGIESEVLSLLNSFPCRKWTIFIFRFFNRCIFLIPFLIAFFPIALKTNTMSFFLINTLFLLLLLFIMVSTKIKSSLAYKKKGTLKKPKIPVIVSIARLFCGNLMPSGIYCIGIIGALIIFRALLAMKIGDNFGPEKFLLVAVGLELVLPWGPFLNESAVTAVNFLKKFPVSWPKKIMNSYSLHFLFYLIPRLLTLIALKISDSDYFFYLRVCLGTIIIFPGVFNPPIIFIVLFFCTYFPIMVFFVYLYTPAFLLLVLLALGTTLWSRMLFFETVRDNRRGFELLSRMP
jgi:hypothetical protein